MLCSRCGHRQCVEAPPPSCSHSSLGPLLTRPSCSHWESFRTARICSSACRRQAGIARPVTVHTRPSRLITSLYHHGEGRRVVVKQDDDGIAGRFHPTIQHSMLEDDAPVLLANDRWLERRRNRLGDILSICRCMHRGGRLTLSNTFFRPSRVSAEHSMYFTAPNSRASCSP